MAAGLLIKCRTITLLYVLRLKLECGWTHTQSLFYTLKPYSKIKTNQNLIFSSISSNLYLRQHPGYQTSEYAKNISFQLTSEMLVASKCKLWSLTLPELMQQCQHVWAGACYWLQTNQSSVNYSENSENRNKSTMYAPRVVGNNQPRSRCWQSHGTEPSLLDKIFSAPFRP